MDAVAALESLVEELTSIQKEVNKLKAASVSAQALRKRTKDAHKSWLPIAGVLETGTLVDAASVQDVSNAWSTLAKLTNNPSPKKQYKDLLKVHHRNDGERSSSSVHQRLSDSNDR